MKLEKINKIVFYGLLLLNIFLLSSLLSFHFVLHGETVKIPDLEGKTFEEAREMLGPNDISVAKLGEIYHLSLERGKIVQQNPRPGSRIRIHKTVGVILSAGSEKVTVPRLVGRNIQDADSILSQAGLLSGDTSQAHTPKYAASRIIGQYPAAGSDVPRNSHINLLVSQGENERQYLMPDLLGRTLDSTLRELRGLGFRIGDIRYSYYPGLDSGIIIKQTPRQGYRIQKRTLISLEVSK
ncbi:MAG: PASTA domain-containing protein [Candidatus Aminicenantes bacterium]|nr:PASTA domain-containing protein [Candidatus Aminicenantes bacterium]